jgi:translation elongation factor EF-Tu-like GTPase
VTDLDDGGEFRFRVESWCVLTGRGTLVFGAIEKGEVRVGDPLRLVRDPEPIGRCLGIDTAMRTADWHPGQPAVVGLLLEGFTADKFQPGDAIAGP